MAQPFTVVFDLGNVLLNFSLEPFARFIEAHGRSFEEAIQLYESIGGLEFEHGKLATPEFLARINNLRPKPAETDKIATAWCEIFAVNQPMISILEKCKLQSRVFILSNSNELHWDYVCAEFAIDRLVEDYIASHHVGYMKPAPEIYSAAEKRFSLVPQETVFIDDMLENVAGAEQAGWHAIHHQDVDSTRSQLIEFGLAL